MTKSQDATRLLASEGACSLEHGSLDAGNSFKITIGSSLDDDSEPAVITLEGSVSDGGTSLGKDSGAFIHEGTRNEDIVIQYDGGVG